MDPVLVKQLENDPAFAQKAITCATGYIKLGKDQLNYIVPDFDIVSDLINCYRPMAKVDVDMLDRGHPRRFMVPLVSTQIEQMTQFITHVLFGSTSPNVVSGRGPEDDKPAELMNQLLRWNSEQNSTYLIGMAFVRNALAYNRGVFYDSVATQYGIKMVDIEKKNPFELVPSMVPQMDPVTQAPVIGEDGQPVMVEDVDPETGDPIMVPKTYIRQKPKKTPIGLFTKVTLVAPEDFIIDPNVSPYRLQEDARFVGHRVRIPYLDLVSRSQLPVEDPAYIMPSAIEKLKKKTKGGNKMPSYGGTATSSNGAKITSRSAFERSRLTGPTNEKSADQNDHGMIECMELWVRLIPKDYELGEDEDVQMFQFLLAGDDLLLAVNDVPYLHGQFPYSIGEGRPASNTPYQPGFALQLKGIQDRVNYLNDKHSETQARTTGSVFLYDPSKVAMEDFLDPDKTGLVIPIRPEAAGEPLENALKQIPIQDMTRNFYQEMEVYNRMAESVTAANSQMQGQSTNADSATAFAGLQQMAAGRQMAIARLISIQALLPQTKRIVANFQQFLDENTQMVLSIRGDSIDDNPAVTKDSRVTITSDVIQGSFDYAVQDLTMPGSDTRKVAAQQALLQSASQPQFASYFDPMVAGNVDLKRVFLDMIKSTGGHVENYIISEKMAAENRDKAVKDQAQKSMAAAQAQLIQQKIAAQAQAAAGPQPGQPGPQPGPQGQPQGGVPPEQMPKVQPGGPQLRDPGSSQAQMPNPQPAGGVS